MGTSSRKDLIEELRWEYTEIFLEYLSKLDQEILKEVHELGRRNSYGDIWILGGFPFKAIVEGKYNIETKRKKDDKGREIIDVDLVVDRLTREPYDPRVLGWSQKRTRYGNPSYRKIEPDNYSVVPNDLHNFHPIVAQGLEPTIENLLDNTPLSSQSLAWHIIGDDLYTGRLIGNKGIMSICERIVRINNLSEVEYEIEMDLVYSALEKGMLERELREHIKTLDMEKLVAEYVKEKAEELVVFDYDLTGLKNPGKKYNFREVIEEKLEKLFVLDDKTRKDLFE